MFKKSMVVSGPTKFDSLAFKEGLVAGIKDVAALNFDAVELAVKNPFEVNAAEIKKLTDELALPVVALGTGQSFVEDGLSLTAASEDIRTETLKRLRGYADMAATFGDTKVIVGLIRGKKESTLNEETIKKYLLEGMREACNYAASKDIQIVLEPINRYETDIINTVAEAITFIKETGCKNLKILLDTFHMNIEEPIIEESIKEAANASLIGHVHVADSNRWAPGSGHLDFASIIDTLRECGYKGALSAEILPKPDPASSARLTIENFNRLLD